MALVGKKAPQFAAGAVINGEEIVENFNLDQYIGKKNIILFFYPKDFTFVCPTEIHAFQEKLAEFKYPAIYREIPDLGHQYLTVEMFEEMLRWVDSLDKM